jgi:hypothetical protein
MERSVRQNTSLQFNVIRRHGTASDVVPEGGDGVPAFDLSRPVRRIVVVDDPEQSCT